jgi:predicted dehydrogenase
LENEAMSEKICRWGVLSSANIARKNWQAIRNAGNATLVAVASRDINRAAQFINECESFVPFPTPPVAYGSYQELLDRKDVDAVYVPLPTGIRKEWVIKAARAGKHVLCEKPCGTTAVEVREMLQACQAALVQFMDGVMFMHSARLPLLRQTLDDGTSVGPLRRIASQFSFAADEAFLRGNIRVSRELEPLGALGDLGWYNIRFSLWVMKEELPESVTGRLLTSNGGVPLEFSGELFFREGISASFFCSFLSANQQTAFVSGMKGFVSLDDFVIPFVGCESAFTVNQTQLRIHGCDFEMGSHPRRIAAWESANNAPDAQETNLFRTFSEIVNSGKLEPKWGETALHTQIVLDACLDSARQDSKRIAVKEKN